MRIISKSEQHNAPLFGGRLHENRPISFPQGKHTDAYSNLFYWANVEAIEDGEFGLHPHRGFEIMTFIFKGALEHYDTKTEKWTALKAGGVQVIQSGDGVQHAEKYTKGSQAFQIWFDPDFSKALQKPAAYKDYQVNEFSFVGDHDGMRVKDYVGNKGPIAYDAEGIEVKAVSMDANSSNSLAIDPDKIYSMYLLEGEVYGNGQRIAKDDYVIMEDQSNLSLISNMESTLFIVATPKHLNYHTYAEQIKGI